MKYIIAVIFIIGAALSFPVGESEQSKSSDSIINPNSLSSAKSQESDELQKQDREEEIHKDVSHEHHKNVQQDSSEASEESSESNEKSEHTAKMVEPIKGENKSDEEKLLDESMKIADQELEKSEVKSQLELEKPKMEIIPKDKVENEKPVALPNEPISKTLLDEKIDILETANKPAAIAAESAIHEEHYEKIAGGIPEKQIKDNPIPLSDSLPEGKEIEENPLDIKSELPEPQQNLQKNGDISIDLKPEEKPELLDAQAPLEIKNEKPKADMPLKEISLQSELKEEIEKTADIVPEKKEAIKNLESASLPENPEASSEKLENINSSS